MRIRPWLRKTLSGGLSGVLFSTQVVLAYAPEGNFWAARRKEAKKFREASAAPLVLAGLPAVLGGSNLRPFLQPLPSFRLPETMASGVPREFTETHAALLSCLSIQYGTVRKIVLGDRRNSPVVVHI